jgi:hypothetical protein
MTSTPIITLFQRFQQFTTGRNPSPPPANLCRLSFLAAHPEQLPPFVRHSSLAHRYLQLFAPLDWERLPQRCFHPNGCRHPLSFASLAAACLLKLDQQLVSMGRLRQFLLDHPALIWLFDFPCRRLKSSPWGFDPDASLPTARHLTRMLRTCPNSCLQHLLDSSVDLIRTDLTAVGLPFGQTIALDTKHILAWVRENNPKAYLKAGQRYAKQQQPKGDPDCRLGCKRRRNQRASSQEPPPTPADEPLPAHTIAVGEYYWGYASGVVATKSPGWGEFVLAERTMPFDQPDVAYFFPLMADTERRLGYRPKFAAFDAAFDAFYIYDYFHSDQHDGFAAIPFVERGGLKSRLFDPDGLPLCRAGLPMPCKYTFQSNSRVIQHEAGRYVCPLHFPEQTGQPCPVNHKQWAKGGCIATLPTCIGARLRYQLDRSSDRYKQIYNQRTAVERINAQAVELGIERPRLRNGQAIANLNTLIYVLINLRALHRIRKLMTKQLN